MSGQKGERSRVPRPSARVTPTCLPLQLALLPSNSARQRTKRSAGRGRPICPPVRQSLHPTTRPPSPRPAAPPAQRPRAPPPPRATRPAEPAAPGRALHSPAALRTRRAAHETESWRRAAGPVLGTCGRCREITWIRSAAAGGGAGWAGAHGGSRAPHAVRPDPGTAPGGHTEAGARARARGGGQGAAGGPQAEFASPRRRGQGGKEETVAVQETEPSGPGSCPAMLPRMKRGEKGVTAITGLIN